MKLNEYLTENGVKLMIKGSGENYPPRQTNDLGMYDYAEGLENVIGKMAWICDYRANADPTKKPIRNIKPTPVVVTDAKETSKTIYYSPVYFRPLTPPTIEIVGFLGGAARFIAKPCLKQRVMRFPIIRYGCSA